jgi:hypothetical protein
MMEDDGLRAGRFSNRSESVFSSSVSEPKLINYDSRPCACVADSTRVRRSKAASCYDSISITSWSTVRSYSKVYCSRRKRGRASTRI